MFVLSLFDMARMKVLLPSLKEKKRYVVFEVITQKSIKQFNVVWNALRTTFRNLFGDFGIASAGLMFVEYDSKSQRGIIRCSHKFVDTVRASFTLILKVNNDPVVLRSIGTSGILKKAREKHLMEV